MSGGKFSKAASGLSAAKDGAEDERVKLSKIAKSLHDETSKKKLRVSFRYFDILTEGFFVHGMDMTFYEQLFGTFDRITKYTEDDIRQQRADDLKPKAINWDADYITKQSFPVRFSLDEYVTRDKFEIRITLMSGRIHGFIFSQTFYVVWIDPCHNLYPGLEKNKRIQLVKAEDYIKVRCISPEVVNELTRDREAAIAEKNETIRFFEKETDPAKAELPAS